MATAVEAALARHRAISIGALIVLTLIAWAWLLSGADMEMKPFVSLAPISDGSSPMPGMAMANPAAWSLGPFAVIFVMWWVMMVAMMLPSATPMILLYVRAATNPQTDVRPATGSFVAGYLIAWGTFSLGAALLQRLLEWAELLTPMTMASQSRWLSAGILITVGIYQMGPLKDVCLRHCRSPAQFLSNHYRAGPIGALRMGLLHGTFCVGCCWLLMALLFVGGVMNLAWIALLSLMVAAEKLLPFGRYVSIAASLACIGWGTAILIG